MAKSKSKAQALNQALAIGGLTNLVQLRESLRSANILAYKYVQDGQTNTGEAIRDAATIAVSSNYFFGGLNFSNN